MKLFDHTNGTIQALDDDGKGVLQVGEKQIHIPFVLPGDIVEAMPIKRQQGTLYGRMEAITKPSPDRITPPCPHVGSCGGCPLQALGYDAQKKWKRQFVVDAFTEQKLEIAIPEVMGETSLFHHRNRMDYVIGVDKQPNANGKFVSIPDSLVIGLKENGRWWKTVDLSTCLMLSPESVEVMRRTKQWLTNHNLRGWDARTHEGDARYLVIREGKNTGERMVIIVTGDITLPDPADFVRTLGPLATTVYHAVNATITDLSIGQTYTLLSGAAVLSETINGITYHISPTAFFQTNTEGATLLAEIVRGFVQKGKHETILDLYCGVGFFALQLAKEATRVLGIEIDPSAIVSAQENAQRNKCANVEFRSEKAEQLSWETESPDLVIVDPPRAGLHPEVVKLLLQKLPNRIIYVSCNYRSLAKELPQFLTKYALTNIQLLDMFPHTPHVETVILLEKM
jgi:23S rRNA (uracil-5-)-methyltransferase RumA